MSLAKYATKATPDEQRQMGDRGSLWINDKNEERYNFIKDVILFIKKKYGIFPKLIQMSLEEYKTMPPSEIKKITDELQIILVPKSDMQKKYFLFFK
jgi:hypothetical protein